MTDSLWKDRSFNLFWMGQTLSTVGDAFTVVALPLLVYETTRSVASMATVTACTAAGAVASGLVAGVLVDRVDRRWLLAWTDLARACLMAVIPLASSAGALSIGMLAGVAALMGVLGNTFGIGYVAFVPELVSKERVLAANARLQGSAAASFVVGPALAGVAVQRWGAESALGVDALSFVASFLSLLAVRARAPLTPRRRDDAITWRTGLVRGAAFLLRLRPLRTVALVLVVELFATAAVLDLFTFHLKSTLGQSDERVGTMFAIASVGAIAGAAIAGRVRRRIGMRGAFVVTTFLLALALGVVRFASSFHATAMIAVAFTFAVSMRGVLSMTRRQELTPDHLLGRVTAVFWLALSASKTVGAYAVGLIAGHYSNVVACQVAAAILLVLSLTTITARSLDEQPES
ncbi:MAG TPA: MFS transporter [Kofleriaceae bacterium]